MSIVNIFLLQSNRQIKIIAMMTSDNLVLEEYRQKGDLLQGVKLAKEIFFIH